MQASTSCKITEEEEELLNQAIGLAQTALFYDQKPDIQKALQYYNQAIYILETDAKSATQKKPSVFKIFTDTYKERVKILQKNLKSTMNLSKDSKAINLQEDLITLEKLKSVDSYDRIIAILKLFDSSISKGAYFSSNLYVPYFVWYADCETQHSNFYNRCFLVLSELAEILDAFLESEGKALSVIVTEIKGLRATLLRLYKEQGSALYEAIKNDTRENDTSFLTNVQGKLNNYKNMVLKNLSKIYSGESRSDQRGIYNKIVFDVLKLLLEVLPIVRMAQANEPNQVSVDDLNFIFAFVRDLVFPILITDLQFRLGAHFSSMREKYS